MDSQVWRTVYQTILAAHRRLPSLGRRPRYPDSLIVAMHIWAAWHDRPLCWAADRSHYNTLFRPRALPSNSQFCKRLKTDRVQRILQEVHNQLASTEIGSTLSMSDPTPRTPMRAVAELQEDLAEVIDCMPGPRRISEFRCGASCRLMLTSASWQWNSRFSRPKLR
jgi:hypothetical protein